MTIYQLKHGAEVHAEGNAADCWKEMLTRYKNATLGFLAKHNIRIEPKS